MTAQGTDQHVERVAELVAAYEACQDDAARRVADAPGRLLALVEEVRSLCFADGAVDAAAVAALRERTGLSFRVEGDAVLFELADDANPGKTQTVTVRGSGAGVG